MVGSNQPIRWKGQVGGRIEEARRPSTYQDLEGTIQLSFRRFHWAAQKCLRFDAAMCCPCGVSTPKFTRVSYLLEGIQCSDAGLQAAMASFRTDDGPTGMRNDFERAAAHLLPYDPVAKRRATATNKRGSSQISAVDAAEGIDDDPTAQASSATATAKKRKAMSTVDCRKSKRTNYESGGRRTRRLKRTLTTPLAAISDSKGRKSRSQW